MTHQDLIDRIHEAFGSTAYPGDDKILVCKAEEVSYHPFGDTALAAAIFMGRRWQDVDCARLNHVATSVLNLSLIGSSYYTPSIMIFSFSQDTNSNLFIWMNRYFFGDYDETYEINALYSSQQRRVVHDFLLFIEVDDARNAAEIIWKDM